VLCLLFNGLTLHRSSDAPDVARKSEATAQNIMPLIYETGKMAGLIDSALLGRIQMVLDGMKADIANSCANIAALYREYALSCKSLVEKSRSAAQSDPRPIGR
jgi:hypothetical protein